MGPLHPELLVALVYGPLAVALVFTLLTLRALLSRLRPHHSFALAVTAGKGNLLTKPASRGLRG